jgi:hypothetical protein
VKRRPLTSDDWASLVFLALIAVLVAALMAGCVAQGDRAEFAWQALNAVDTAQTATGLSGNCHEANPAFGFVDSPGDAILLGAGLALAHGYLTKWLERHDASRTTMVVYHSVGIAAKAYAVASNASKRC